MVAAPVGFHLFRDYGCSLALWCLNICSLGSVSLMCKDRGIMFVISQEVKLSLLR